MGLAEVIKIQESFGLAENSFDVSSEGSLSRRLFVAKALCREGSLSRRPFFLRSKRRSSPCIFQVVVSLSIPSLLIIGIIPTAHRPFKNKYTSNSHEVNRSAHANYTCTHIVFSIPLFCKLCHEKSLAQMKTCLISWHPPYRNPETEIWHSVKVKDLAMTSQWPVWINHNSKTSY